MPAYKAGRTLLRILALLFWYTLHLLRLCRSCRFDSRRASYTRIR